MLWSNDSCQNRVFAGQYHMTVSRAQVSTHLVRVFFKVIRWQVTMFQMIAGSSLIFLNSYEICCAYVPHNWNFDFKLTSDSKIQPAITGTEDSCFWVFSLWSRVGHPLRPIFMLWLVKIWQVRVMRKIYAASWILFTLTAESDRVLCQLNRLFPLDVQNEILLLSRVFRYSWLVCLLGFWLRNTSLVKVGNPISDGIVFVFHLAWCVRGLKSLKRFWPYLIVFSASRMVSLSNYCIWCLFFISNLMKSSVVYVSI